MNVVVILRAVRDPASFTINRRAEKIFVHRDEFMCNPADLNALEAALRLPEAEVTAVSYGGAPAEDVLRMARALGADRAVLVAEPSLQLADAARITEALLGVLRNGEPPTLVLLGDEVLDGDTAQVGPRLAEALDWPYVESACQVELMDGGEAKAIVRTGGGYRALAAQLPAVVSVARDSNRVRYPPAAGVITHFREAGAVEKLSLEGLGVEASAPACVEYSGEVFPPERKYGEVLDGALTDTMAALEAVLRLARDRR